MEEKKLLWQLTTAVYGNYLHPNLHPQDAMVAEYYNMDEGVTSQPDTHE